VNRSASPTLADVAERASVSLATASRVLNSGGQRRVGEEYRARVLAAAEELGYTPHAQAQAVARGANNLLGLIVHDIADPYFSAIAAGVMRQAEKHGLITTMASTDRDPQRELEYVRVLRSQRVRVMVLAGTRIADRALARRLAEELSLPVTMAWNWSSIFGL
jgi:LacI family transcriptional regulator